MSARTPEQSLAAGERGIDVFCPAGAGTGKTTVLVDRFVGAITEDGAEMGSLLAFTFTERAAAQLRRRIRDRLREASARADDPAKARELEALARETTGAMISTIHGFCRRLVAAYPVAAGVDPGFRVLDEGEAGRLRARAGGEALEAVLAADDEHGTASRMVAAFSPRGIRSLASSAYDELRSLGHALPDLPDPPPTDLTEAVEALNEAAERALAEVEECEGPRRADFDDAIGAARAFAGEYSESGRVPRLDEIDGFGFGGRSGKRYKGEACAAYERAVTVLRRASAEREFAGAYELIRQLVREFGTRYERLKARRSGLDFEDLQLRAAALLEGNPGVREAFTGRLSHLLVDEFQDTNELQLRLVRALAGPSTRTFLVGDELQSIYGFRHADLAVYRRERERHADLDDSAARILPLTGNFRAHAEIVAAVNSIGAKMIGRGFEPLRVGSERQAEPADAPPVELLVTAEKRTDEQGELTWSDEEVALEQDDDDPAPAHRAAEARLLARRLREICDSGVPRSDVVVLLRAMTAASTYEEALEAAGLAPYVVGGSGYWSQQQVGDVLAILAVIANPVDDKAVYGALASPACGATPDTLLALRRIAQDRANREPNEGAPRLNARAWNAIGELLSGESPQGSEAEGWAEAVEPAELELLRTFRERIEGLRLDAPHLGLEGLIEAACARLRYDLATLMRERGEARWANVRKLMRLARDYEATEPGDLRGFLTFAEDEAERAAEAEAATIAEGHDGVRVMTIHAAKGLEFPVVAVPELGRRLLAGFPPGLRVGPVRDESDDAGAEGASPLRVGLRVSRIGRKGERLYAYEDLQDEADADGSAEELRLVHVAATRAESRLVLSGVLKGKWQGHLEPGYEWKPGDPAIERIVAGHAAGTPLGELLAAGESATGEIEVPAAESRPGLEAGMPAGRIRAQVSFPAVGEGRALEPPASEAPADDAGEDLGAPPLLDPARPVTAGARLSYSALASYSRCGYRFFAERELKLGSPAPARPATAGEDGSAGAPADASADAVRDEAGDTEMTEPTKRFGFGNAVHRLLEWSARSRWREPGRDRVERVLAAEGLGAEEAERALEMVRGWLGSALCAELREKGARVEPEAPFMLRVRDSVIRGSIDLLARIPGEPPVVVDFKTDRLGGDDPDQRANDYRIQRWIYALAVAGADGSDEVRTAYCFLERAGEPAEATLGPGDLAESRAEIETLLAGIAAGRFEVTRHPHARLCHDCPARHRLCSHSPEAMLRESPDPPVEPRGPAGEDSARRRDGPAGENPTASEGAVGESEEAEGAGEGQLQLGL